MYKCDGSSERLSALVKRLEFDLENCVAEKVNAGIEKINE